MKASYLYVLGFSLALVAATASAQQYKWKDARGRWQYGDIPPTGVKAVPLKPPPPRPAAPTKPAGGDAGAKAAAKDSKPLTPAEQEMEFRRRVKEAQDKAAKTAKEEEAERDRKRNCDLARAQERSLADPQMRVAGVNEKGERYYPSDEQRKQGLAEARASVGEWCK